MLWRFPVKENSLLTKQEPAVNYVVPALCPMLVEIVQSVHLFEVPAMFWFAYEESGIIVHRTDLMGTIEVYYLFGKEYKRIHSP